MNGNKIKQLRKDAGLTQIELGQKLGVVKQTVSSWENNISEPKNDILVKLSKILNTSPDYLLGNETQDIVASKYLPEKYDTNIKYWIQKTGDGYAKVANQLGITEDTLKDYMDERIDIPYQILIALSEICEVSTDCLLGIIDKSRERDLNDILPFRYNYDIARQIKMLCEKSNIDINSSFLENLLCLSKKEIHYLLEYGFIPHIDTIIQLSKFFNVSCDYLLCQINDQDEKFIKTFTLLNEDDKDIIIGEMKKSLKEQKYNRSVAADETNNKRTGTDNLGK